VADYPFTTLYPNLGVVYVGQHRSFVMADIPGLIEGAAEGKGLGHQFLRHVERARVLVVLLDLATEERTPEEQQRILLDELGRYEPDLLARPRLVVGSKADVAVHDYPGLQISAVTREHLDEFVGRLGEMIDQARAEEPEAEGFVVLRPQEEGFAIVRDDDGAWRVRGRNAERVVAMADLTNFEALEYVHQRFRKMGVERALERAGARDGDIVRVAEFEFEYEEGLS
jgi:GTP-binding protein